MAEARAFRCVGLWNYEASDKDQLSMAKGEEVTLLQEDYNVCEGAGPEIRWRRALVQNRHIKTGYVPRAFLESKRIYARNEDVYRGTWFAGRIKLDVAVQRLTRHHVTGGTFLVCAPTNYPREHGFTAFALVVRLELDCSHSEKESTAESEPPPIDIFRIRRDRHGRYYVGNGEPAANLYSLVKMLRQHNLVLSIPLKKGPVLGAGEKSPAVPAPPTPTRILFARPDAAQMQSTRPIRTLRKAVMKQRKQIVQMDKRTIEKAKRKTEKEQVKRRELDEDRSQDVEESEQSMGEAEEMPSEWELVEDSSVDEQEEKIETQEDLTPPLSESSDAESSVSIDQSRSPTTNEVNLTSDSDVQQTKEDTPEPTIYSSSSLLSAASVGESEQSNASVQNPEPVAPRIEFEQGVVVKRQTLRLKEPKTGDEAEIQEQQKIQIVTEDGSSETESLQSEYYGETAAAPDLVEPTFTVQGNKRIPKGRRRAPEPPAQNKKLSIEPAVVSALSNAEARLAVIEEKLKQSEIEHKEAELREKQEAVRLAELKLKEEEIRSKEEEMKRKHDLHMADLKRREDELRSKESELREKREALRAVAELKRKEQEMREKGAALEQLKAQEVELGARGKSSTSQTSVYLSVQPKTVDKAPAREGSHRPARVSQPPKNASQYLGYGAPSSAVRGLQSTDEYFSSVPQKRPQTALVTNKPAGQIIPMGRNEQQLPDMGSAKKEKSVYLIKK